MTRDELVQDIKEEIEKVIPENKELEGEDIDAIETTIENVLEQSAGALDEAEKSDEDAEGDEEK